MPTADPSRRSPHARAQVWVYGVLALVALGALGTSIASIAVSRVRQRGVKSEEYFPAGST